MPKSSLLYLMNARMMLGLMERESGIKRLSINYTLINMLMKSEIAVWWILHFLNEEQKKDQSTICTTVVDTLSWECCWAWMKPLRTVSCQYDMVWCEFHLTLLQMCVHEACAWLIRDYCFTLLILMDRQPLDQTVQCIGMFAAYTSGRLRCLHYHAEVIWCSAALFVLKCIPNFIKMKADKFP